MPRYSKIQSRKQGVFMWLFLIVWVSQGLLAGSQLTYEYGINLQDIQKDRYQVTLNCESFATDTLIFHFPWIIPGTYMEANYGKFIRHLEVHNTSGETIKAKRKGKNTYIITPANDIAEISYWVGGTWESKSLRTIWPMAGTGVIPERTFVINAGGVFGYFQGHELSPVEMTYHYPKNLYAMSVLDQTKIAPGKVSISTTSYHELIDSPIMFAYPDTTSFRVHGTEVLVGFSHESDDTRRAPELKVALEPSMNAIAAYIDSLPCDRYAYLIHYTDARALGKILDNPKFMVFKGVIYFLRNGVPMGGALEHNKSSFYYLPDPGSIYTEYITRTIKDISIHEFMHILTPLNLHSQHIDNWDYNDPVLSKHLWLYEGVTEYLSEIIQVNGGLESYKDFLLSTMRSKIRRGESFPLDEMSFTEMAENVLEKPYKGQFTQVYQRGAVMGMLLDIEIIRLTEGRKRLIDVMLELADDYGPSKPMDEEQIFDLFTDKVHPDLRSFFTKYIEGREDLPYEEILSHVGILYQADTTLMHPRHPIDDLDVKRAGIRMGPKRTIKKVGKKMPIDLRKGDQFENSIYLDHYFDDMGRAMPEGMVVQFPILRHGNMLDVSDTVTYMEKSVQHFIEFLPEMSPTQSTYFNIWLGFENTIPESNGQTME